MTSNISTSHSFITKIKNDIQSQAKRLEPSSLVLWELNIHDGQFILVPENAVVHSWGHVHFVFWHPSPSLTPFGAAQNLPQVLSDLLVAEIDGVVEEDCVIKLAENVRGLRWYAKFALAAQGQHHCTKRFFFLPGRGHLPDEHCLAADWLLHLVQREFSLGISY